MKIENGKGLFGKGGEELEIKSFNFFQVTHTMNSIHGDKQLIRCSENTVLGKN